MPANGWHYDNDFTDPPIKRHKVRTSVKPLSSILRSCLATTALAVLLSGCGGGKWGFPYKQDLQQGNWITASQVAQLEPGMSREQVRYVLGTPSLQNVFRDTRWDYPYYSKPGYGDIQQRRFTVYFEDDLLVSWSGDEQPNRQPFEKSDTGEDTAQPTSRQNETNR